MTTGIQVEAFVIRREGQPQVTANRRGRSWQFAWSGGSTLLTCSQADAERVATQIADDLGDIAPLQAEVDRRHADIVTWIESQREEP